MSGKIHSPENKHPEPYQQDLNPDASKGINWGLAGPHPEKDNPRTAKDVKELHDLLSEFRDDELDQIPVLPAGSRLESNATYINFREAEAGEFTAEGKSMKGSDGERKLAAGHGRAKRNTGGEPQKDRPVPRGSGRRTGSSKKP